MTQIRIDTQRVRDFGRQFHSHSDQLNDIDNALQSAINSLDTWAWDGHSRANAEPMLEQVRPVSRDLANELERLGEMLVHVANRFEDTDNTVVRFEPPPPPPVDFWNEFLNNLNPKKILGIIGGFAVKIFDDVMGEFLDSILPLDLEGAEFFTFKAEGGATIPLEALGLPFSGYLNGENGLTIRRNDDGSYSVVIGDVGSVGIEELGAKVGLRNEGGYEFKFNPNEPGDLSKMGWLLTTLAGSKALSAVGIPGLDKMAQGVNAGMLQDNLVSMNGGVGIEASANIDMNIPGQKLDIEGTAMVGAEMRRKDKDLGNEWEYVTSFKLTGQAEGKIDALEAFKVEGSLGYEFTFNEVTNMQSQAASTEVILEIQASAGGELDWDKIGKLLPEGGKFEELDVATGKLKIKYTLDSSVNEAMQDVTSGNFDAIVNNSSIEVSASTGLKTTTTIGGEIKNSIGPSIGGKAEVEISSGREVEVVVWEKDYGA